MNSKKSTKSGKDRMSIEKLAVVVESLDIANEALMDINHYRDDEIGRLDHFEAQIGLIRDEFSQFKELADTHDEQTDELLIRLNQENHKYQQTSEDLKKQIIKLKEEIDNQSRENEQLGQRLFESVESLNKLKFCNDALNENSYANAFPMVTNPIQFNQHLCENIK